ncbi:MAG: SDR family NAD(P)-dependent oxidoreductase [Chloroflexota bacterium]
MQDSQRVALITGASSGIGRAAALAFAREGTAVVLVARRAERLEALQREIDALPGHHGAAVAITGDVREAGVMRRAVDEALARFGRLDILVANAGVGHRGALVDADWDDLETLLRTNIDGVLHAIRAAVPAMRQTGGGHIVIVSSVTAGMVGPYMALYAASKTFVSNLAASLRIELKEDHIHVTDMRVGRTVTEFNEKRLGKPGRASGFGPSSMPAEKVADAIVRATHQRRKLVVLRPIDRLILLANTFAPGVVAWFVARQYR